MSKEYDDTNTGIIGTNDYKQKDTHPDQKGRVNVNGLWYWVSGWDKVSNSRKFTSLAFTLMTQGEVDAMMEKRKAKQAPQQGAQQQTQQQAAPKSGPTPQQSIPEGHPAGEAPMDFDEDIPF